MIQQKKVTEWTSIQSNITKYSPEVPFCTSTVNLAEEKRDQCVINQWRNLDSFVMIKQTA